MRLTQPICKELKPQQRFPPASQAASLTAILVNPQTISDSAPRYNHNFIIVISIHFSHHYVNQQQHGSIHATQIQVLRVREQHGFKILSHMASLDLWNHSQHAWRQRLGRLPRFIFESWNSHFINSSCVPRQPKTAHRTFSIIKLAWVLRIL